MTYKNDQSAYLNTLNDLNKLIDGKTCGENHSGKSRKRKSINEALIRASKKGRLHDVKKLLEYGADINYAEVYLRGFPGDTSIKIALSYGHYDLAKYLFEKGANAGREELEKLLTAAAKNNDAVYAFKLIKQGVALNPADRRNKSPLKAAVESGHYEMTKLLLRHGADPNRESEGKTPFIVAVLKDNIDIMKELVKNGAKIENTNYHCGEAFYDACYKGDFKRVCELMKLGISYRLTDRYGYSGLMAAAYGGHAGIAEFLINKGADVNHRTLNNQNALIYCLTQIDPKKITGCMNVVKLLLERGSEVNVIDGYGNSALSALSVAPYPEEIKTRFIKKVIEKEACVNTVFPDYSYFHKNILIWSITNNNREIFDLCLKKGADIYSKDREGTPAFFHLIKDGSADIMDIFTKSRNIYQIAPLLVI